MKKWPQLPCLCATTDVPAGVEMTCNGVGLVGLVGHWGCGIHNTRRPPSVHVGFRVQLLTCRAVALSFTSLISEGKCSCGCWEIRSTAISLLFIGYRYKYFYRPLLKLSPEASVSVGVPSKCIFLFNVVGCLSAAVRAGHWLPLLYSAAQR